MKNLNEIPGRNPFKVPDNYFEEVNRKIISATSGKEIEVEKQKIPVRSGYSFAIAASFALMVLLGYSAIRYLTTEKNQISEINFDEFTDDQYLNELDIYSIEEKLSSIEFSEEIPVLNQTDLIDYLLLEDINIDEINENL